MIIAFWVFSQSIAQAIVNHFVISSRTRLIFSLTVAGLSMIPLLLQFSILVGELLPLPCKYWIKLPLHRLLMGLFGEHGPAINLVVKQYSRKKFHFDEYRTRPFRRCIAYVAHLTAQLLGRVVFNDAFSGMYSMRTASRGIFLVRDYDVDASRPGGWSWSALLSRLDLLMSNSSSDARLFIPEILQDLEVKRRKLCDQMNRIFPGEERRRKILDRMNRIFPEGSEQRFDQDGNINWHLDQDGKIDWHLLFKSEENFRWEILSGEELTLELFKLWNLKNGIRMQKPDTFLVKVRAEAEDVWGKEEADEVWAEVLADSTSMDEVAARAEVLADSTSMDEGAARAEVLADSTSMDEVGARAKVGMRANARVLEWAMGGRAEVGMRANARVLAWVRGAWAAPWAAARAEEGATAGAWAAILAWARAEEGATAGAWASMLAKAWAGAEEVAVVGTVARADHAGVWGDVERGPPPGLTEMAGALAAWGGLGAGPMWGYKISKMIRNIQLQVTINPVYKSRKLKCHVRATGSQDNYVSKLYIEEILVMCKAENATELGNLMAILENNTFLCKTENATELLNFKKTLEKNTFLLNLDSTDVETTSIYSCTSLESIIRSILEEGHKIFPLNFNKRVIFV